MIYHSAIIVLFLMISCGQVGKKSKNQDKQIRAEVTTQNINKRVNCFIYHRFGDSRYPTTNVSTENFRSHLDYLKEDQFEVLSFSDAIKYLKDDQPEKKVAVITVDDGFRSFYENGLPLLEKYGFPATLFINTETVGGSSYMNWEEIKDASERGIEIGNHTHSHAFFLNQAPEKRYSLFEEEIRLCQQLIQENLNIKSTVFAYPYGEFDQKMKEIVQNAGFVAAAAQNSGVISNDSDLMACPRFPMATGFSDIQGFKLKANALPLKVMGLPDNHIISDSYKPDLNLTIEKDELRLNEMQCFIQGGDCKLNLEQSADNEYSISVEPDQSIRNRRRTLYTLTVQDKNNQWYWLSHLWINPKIKE